MKIQTYEAQLCDGLSYLKTRLTNWKSKLPQLDFSGQDIWILNTEYPQLSHRLLHRNLFGWPLSRGGVFLVLRAWRYPARRLRISSTGGQSFGSRLLLGFPVRASVGQALEVQVCKILWNFPSGNFQGTEMFNPVIFRALEFLIQWFLGHWRCRSA